MTAHRVFIYKHSNSIVALISHFMELLTADRVFIQEYISFDTLPYQLKKGHNIYLVTFVRIYWRISCWNRFIYMYIYHYYNSYFICILIFVRYKISLIYMQN